MGSPSPPRHEPRDPAARKALGWLHSTRFLTTASRLEQLPESGRPEIAFVGRSNAGKSSAINRLAQQRQLAFASRTPGRTQHINLFAIGPREAPDALLADLPGYGYAAVERSAKRRWQEVMAEYLVQRESLRGVVLLVDARLGLTTLDQHLLALLAVRLEDARVSLLVLLTKADKLSRQAAGRALRTVVAELAQALPRGADAAAVLFSALDGTGVPDTSRVLRDWVGQTADRPGEHPDQTST